MTDAVRCLREAIILALPVLERAVLEGEDGSYGYFCGDDPRDFVPDPECSTTEERAKHAADCAAWDHGKNERAPLVHVLIDPTKPVADQIKGASVCMVETNKYGEIVGGSVTNKAGYGQGTTTFRDEEAVAALAACQAALEDTNP